IIKLNNKPINAKCEGNLANIEDNTPEPQIVEFDDDAKKSLVGFRNEIREIRKKMRDAGKISNMVYNRTAQTAEQIALIVAAGVNIDNPMITENEMSYGINLSRHLYCEFSSPDIHN
ncbi:MAG: hypothetical protein ACHP9Y_04585, partial [Gammaproteobacteria bacterium]